MKNIILILISALAFNLAQAAENVPVNFHADQPIGQFIVSIKMLTAGEVTRFDQKICFVSGEVRDQKSKGNFEPGCVGKKLKDTQTELEYLVSCSGRSDMRMSWKRLSTTDFTYTSKDDQSETEATYKYVAEKCDADAIRK